MNRFFLSLLLLISTSSEAALVLPPDLSTQEKQRAFARQIAQDMPGLAAGGYNQDTIINYLRLMQNLLVDRGLLKDEEFKKWAAERPDLKTYIFSTYRTEERTENGVRPEFMAEIQTYFQENFAGRRRRSYDRITADIVKRIGELSTAAAQVQSQALTAGLGSLFPQDQRRDILSQKNITLRTEALKSALAGVPQEELREKFQSERFGIPRNALTMKKAIELLDSAVETEIEFIQAVTLLETVVASKRFAEIDFSPEATEWFTSDDKEARDFLNGFEFKGPAAEVAGRLRSVAKNSFAHAGEVEQVRIMDKGLIVVEQPPHLAVFRSCSGGDCSTGSSWAYPFSPKERNFYFYDIHNPFTEIGYVSGNIVKVGGVDTLYIRDLTGRLMKPEHVDLLIQGFAQMLPEFGVTQMTLTTPGFASRENHFPLIYKRIIEVVGDMPSVNQTFVDARLRLEYLNRVVSTASYDSPARHKTGRLYKADKLPSDILPVDAERVADDYIKTARSTAPTGRAFLVRLEMAVAGNDFTLVNGGPIQYAEWNNYFRLFTNSARASLEDHYAELEKIFDFLGVKLSASIMRDFPQLFYQGHINASDAFTTKDSELLDLSYKMLIDRYVRLKDNNIFSMRGISLETLFKHPAMVKAVTQFLARRAPADGERMYYLLANRFPWETLTLDAEQAQFIFDNNSYWNSQTAAAMIKLVELHKDSLKVSPMFYAALAQVLGYSYGNQSWTPFNNPEFSEAAAILFARLELKNSRHLAAPLQVLSLAAAYDRRPVVAQASAVAFVASGRPFATKNLETAVIDNLRAATRSKTLPEDIRQMAKELVAKIDGTSVKDAKEDCAKRTVSRKKAS